MAATIKLFPGVRMLSCWSRDAIGRSRRRRGSISRSRCSGPRRTV